ncbi:MAG TPA: hypothetical protein VJK48_02760 [Chlamydiales bacterium]|nr:hypothetical protein [Chlamydiales bacterium]
MKKGSFTNEVKTEFLKWLAVSENQVCFLANLEAQVKEQDESVSTDFLRNLNSLKKALEQWTETFTSCPKRHPKRLMFIPAYISRYDRPQNTEEEIEFLQAEAAELKDEASNKLIRAALEAAGAGVTAASGAVWFAGWAIGCASNDVIKGCKMYNDAVELEHRVENLEHTLHDGDDSETNISKRWWEFWK